MSSRKTSSVKAPSIAAFRSELMGTGSGPQGAGPSADMDDGAGAAAEGPEDSMESEEGRRPEREG